ncbi:MAG: pyruvate kinase [Firmicutes bacterium]|nr:pyruvate kinase [Bacillota bacterium]
MRKTKIICTIGPACADEKILTQMCEAGMNVARLNFSHGTHEEHKEKIELIKAVREKLGLPIPIMLDTKGPEYRIKTFAEGSVEVGEGDTFTFTTEDIEGDETKVAVSFKRLIEDLAIGDRILVNNGLVVFEVKELTATEAICTTIVGGTLSNRKSMSFPNKVMSGPYLSDQDKADILFGIENDVDFVAASFVSTKDDMVALRQFLNEHGGNAIDIIAKIENQAGVDNIDEICETCEGIMIARGDLGVEIPFVQVPAIQKYLTNKCRILGKRVITATEMLESMIQNPRPTRAEISDVANAVYDGSSAVMLSGESAAGKYPVESVRSMAQICAYTEGHINYKERFRTSDFQIKNILDAISHTACTMTVDVDAKAIVVCSVTGKTAHMVSRFRSPVPIIGMTTDPKVWRKLALSWGVIPMLAETFQSTDAMFQKAKDSAQTALDLNEGDTIVLTAGRLNGQSGNTDTLKVAQI